MTACGSTQPSPLIGGKAGDVSDIGDIGGEPESTQPKHGEHVRSPCTNPAPSVKSRLAHDTSPQPLLALSSRILDQTPFKSLVPKCGLT